MYSGHLCFLIQTAHILKGSTALSASVALSGLSVVVEARLHGVAAGLEASVRISEFYSVLKMPNPSQRRRRAYFKNVG